MAWAAASGVLSVKSGAHVETEEGEETAVGELRVGVLLSLPLGGGVCGEASSSSIGGGKTDWA